MEQEKGADYLLPKLKEAIKQLYHDHAAGKTAPTKEEFGKRLMSGSVVIKWSQDAPIRKT